MRVYDYGSIRTALTDLTTGACDAFMKLAPVLTELVKPIAGVEVVQRGISVENIAIAVALDDQALLGRITRRAGRARRRRHAAADPPQMVGQPVRPTRASGGVASDQPARGEYHTTRLAGEHQGKKGRDK